jgi:UDPglucose 6-dehydrogenase
MPRKAAEMAKYAANAYLATRISFINEIAAVCAKLGVNIEDVRRGIGTDARIGHHFLYPGIGYGGSCFPKDVQALGYIARQAGVDCGLLDAVHRRNQLQRDEMIAAIRQRLGPDLRGKKLAVWGLAFKPKTDDVREAPALGVVEGVLAAGATVAVHDPRAMDAARPALGTRVTYHDDAYEALRGADALLVCTEWMEYRSPDFERIRADLNQPLIFDGRNVYDPPLMLRYNFEYYSVGRPPAGTKHG